MKNILQLTIEQLNLILLMRVKRNAFLLVKVREGLPYQVDIPQPEWLNVYEVTDVSLDGTDRKLLDHLTNLNFGQLMFTIQDGKFLSFHDYYIKNGGYKTYMLGKDDVYKELEKYSIADRRKPVYNLGEQFNSSALAGAPKKQVNRRKVTKKT